MPTTSNFGWTTPADTDLVKDGASAIRTLGNGVDTSMAQLKGGTTGQILSKTSGTDMAFTWINNDQGDITGVTAGTGISGGGTSGTVTITNSMATEITAAGDIIVGTGSGTFDNLPIGTTGQVLTADTTVSPYKVKWAAASSGGMTLLNSGNTSMSGATHSLTSISGSYKNLQLILRSPLPANDANSLRMRFNGDSTANRHSICDEGAEFGATLTFNNTSVPLGYGMDNVTQTGLFYVTIPDYANTTTWKYAVITSIVCDSTTATSVITQYIHGMYNQTGAITSLDFFFNTGNITSGSVFLYGVA